MSEYEEILETSEDERFRVKLVLDECPPKPYDCSQSPLLRIETRGYGHRAEHIQTGDRPTDADSYIEEAVHHWATCPADSDWRLFEKYLRAFHGVTQIETWNSESYWYVTYDSASWREWCGASEGGADMSEYRAWCKGDVWGWVVEENVTWHADDPDRDDMSTWEVTDDCWGYYGSDGPNGAYLRQCARNALLDAQISDHGGVFGPLPDDGTLTPERIATAVEDMQRVQRNRDADREQEASDV
jgi:hypothetical protein